MKTIYQSQMHLYILDIHRSGRFSLKPGPDFSGPGFSPMKHKTSEPFQKLATLTAQTWAASSSQKPIYLSQVVRANTQIY